MARKQLKHKKVLLISAGLDSVIGYFFLRHNKLDHNLELIHVTKHSRYSEIETNYFLKFVNDLNLTNYRIIELPILKEFEEQDANLPARNLIFAILGAYYGDVIYIPCQYGERDIPDRSDEFFIQSSLALSKVFERPIVIDPLWWTETKQDLLKWYIVNGYDIQFLKEHVYSCYTGNERMCGECNACFRLAIALAYNDVNYVEWFEKDPFKQEITMQYLEKLKTGKYNQRREEQTIETLKKIGVWR